MRKSIGAIIAASSVLGLGLFLAGQDVSAADQHMYVGASKCSTCHKKPEIGNQNAAWAATKHAKAMDSLRTDQAKEWAAERGIEGDPASAPDCVKCHTTAYGVSAELLGSKFNPEEGVSCEACHGAGADYKKKSIMVDQDKAVSLGLIPQSEQVCTNCHNDESPAYKGFDYASAVKEIAHPVPEGYDPYAEDDD